MATVTIAVTDGTGALPLADVSLTGASLFTSFRTDAAGHSVFSVPNGTYTLKVSKAFYSRSETTITVSGDATYSVVLTALAVAAPLAPAKVSLYGEIHSVDDRAIFVRIQEIAASQWNQAVGGNPTDHQAFSAFLWGEERRVRVQDQRWLVQVYAGSMVRVVCDELRLDFEGIVPNGSGPYQLSDLIPRQSAPLPMNTGETPGFSGSNRS